MKKLMYLMVSILMLNLVKAQTGDVAESDKIIEEFSLEFLAK